MAIKGSVRGRVLGGAELRTAVRAFCLQEFEARFGKPWDERWERTLRYDEKHPLRRTAKRERAARELYARLNAVMREAVAFAADQEVQGGRCAIFLSHWPQTHLAPLLEHASMSASPKDWGDNIEEPRARLVKTLEDYNIFQIDQAVGGGSSFLDVREHALVSLLVGNWPAKARATVAEIIELETASVRHHMRKHGQKDHDSADGIFAKRGPKHRASARVAASKTRSRKHEK